MYPGCVLTSYNDPEFFNLSRLQDGDLKQLREEDFETNSEPIILHNNRAGTIDTIVAAKLTFRVTKPDLQFLEDFDEVFIDVDKGQYP